MRQFYYQDPREDDIGLGVGLTILGILIAIWWLIVHFLDWLTFDVIVWWAEPLTFFLLVPFLIMFMEYGHNPLHWWPLFWGTKVEIEGNDFFTVWQKEEASLRYGGPSNVYYNNDYIKFRRKRDAVTFCLLQKFP